MKVVEFKKKSELPKDILYRIDHLAEGYIGVLFETVLRIGGMQPTQEDYDRIRILVIEAFEESMNKAIDKM